MTTGSNDVADADRPVATLPPEFHRLEAAARRLADELAGYRARAQVAEGRVRELERALTDVSSGALDPISLRDRIQALEQENKQLRERLAVAKERVRRLVARFDFLREDL